MDSKNKSGNTTTDAMANKVRMGLLILGMICLNANVFGQTNEWETEKTKDGEVIVRSRISDRIDESGEAVQLIEYVATTTVSVDIQQCIAVLKDVSKHKVFEDYEVSEKIETISDNEWIVYYYTNAPWPMPDNDCVAKMNYTEDDQGSVSFSIIAAPAMLEMKKVDRMTYYEVVYTFKDLGNDKIELMVDAKMSPTIQAPAWMVSSFFPNGPADILRKITELAKSS